MTSYVPLKKSSSITNVAIPYIFPIQVSCRKPPKVVNKETTIINYKPTFVYNDDTQYDSYNCYSSDEEDEEFQDVFCSLPTITNNNTNCCISSTSSCSGDDAKTIYTEGVYAEELEVATCPEIDETESTIGDDSTCSSASNEICNDPTHGDDCDGSIHSSCDLSNHDDCEPSHDQDYYYYQTEGCNKSKTTTKNKKLNQPYLTIQNIEYKNLLDQQQPQTQKQLELSQYMIPTEFNQIQQLLLPPSIPQQSMKRYSNHKGIVSSSKKNKAVATMNDKDVFTLSNGCTVHTNRQSVQTPTNQSPCCSSKPTTHNQENIKKVYNVNTLVTNIHISNNHIHTHNHNTTNDCNRGLPLPPSQPKTIMEKAQIMKQQQKQAVSSFFRQNMVGRIAGKFPPCPSCT